MRTSEEQERLCVCLVCVCVLRVCSRHVSVTCVNVNDWLVLATTVAVIVYGHTWGVGGTLANIKGRIWHIQGSITTNKGTIM